MADSASFHDGTFNTEETRYVEDSARARRIGNSVVVERRRHWASSPAIDRKNIAGEIIHIPSDYERDLNSDPNVPSAEDTYILHGATRPGESEYLMCVTHSRSHRPCTLVTAVKDNFGRFRLDLRLGSPHFLRRGIPMELFITPTLFQQQPGLRLIGGVHGRVADEVRIMLADGSSLTEDVRSTVAPGDAIWTATLSSPVVKVVVVDKHGQAIEKRQVLPCKGGIACEVR